MDYFRVNVVGNINLFNAYMPLVLKGAGKKVITISAGFADLDLTAKYRIQTAVPYSTSKVAVNMAVAKFHAEYSEQGVLFMSICPGLVETGQEEKSKPYNLNDLLRTCANTAGLYSSARGLAIPPKAGCRLYVIRAGYEEVYARGGSRRCLVRCGGCQFGEGPRRIVCVPQGQQAVALNY